MTIFSTHLIRQTPLNADTVQFDFAYIGNSVLFQPGNFFLLEVEDDEPKVTRAYSISSPPNKNFFSLTVKLLPGGKASEYLKKLAIGDLVHFQGPFGHFLLDDSTKDVVMVATGTGIAPFMSMIPSLFGQSFSQEIRLVFGVRFEEDLFYLDQLNAWEEEHSNFKTFVTLSKPTESWKGLSGRVIDHLNDVDPTRVQVYICGNGDMVKSVKELMESKGVPKEDLHYELFSAF